MKPWSWSNARLFRKCQRQWFYKNCFASAKSKDPARREAYVFSTLQTISGWRGQIVDKVIDQEIVKVLNRGGIPVSGTVEKRALALFDTQLEFAKRRGAFKPGMTKTSAGEAFASLYDIEFGSLAESMVEKARAEVQQAIKNLFGDAMKALRTEIRSAKYIAAQRTLQFRFMDHTVRCVPDLIAFFPNGSPPLIVDWKVHVFGTNDYGEQLLTYALAYSRTPPHADFPLLPKWEASELRLVEAQLLTGQTRRHEALDEDFENVERAIARSLNTMLLAVDGRQSGDLQPEDFPPAGNPGPCVSCVFKNICCGRPI